MQGINIEPTAQMFMLAPETSENSGPKYNSVVYFYSLTYYIRKPLSKNAKKEHLVKSITFLSEIAPILLAYMTELNIKKWRCRVGLVRDKTIKRSA